MSDAPATETKADKTKASVDHDTGLVTITRGGNSTQFDLKTLPEPVRFGLAGRGLVVRLTREEDMAKAWADMLAGKLASREAAKPKEASQLAKAIALAMRDELADRRGVKKADKAAHAALLDEATAVVAGMSRQAKITARASAAVTAYVAQLKGKTPGQGSLLDLAGVPAETEQAA